MLMIDEEKDPKTASDHKLKGLHDVGRRLRQSNDN